MLPVENKRYTVSELEFPPPDYPLAIGAAYNRLKDTAEGYADMKSFICFDAGFRAALDFMEQKLTAHNSKSMSCSHCEKFPAGETSLGWKWCPWCGRKL